MKNSTGAVLCSLILLALTVGIPLKAQPPSEGPHPGLPHGSPPNKPPGKDEITVSANGIELAEIIRSFGKRLDKKFLYDESLLTGKKVYLASPITVPREDLYSVLEVILAYFDLAVVPAGGENSQILQIVAVQRAMRKKTPVYVFSTLEDLPDGSEIISLIFPLRNANSTQVISALKPLIGDPAGAIDAAGTNTVIIVDRASNCRRLAAMVQALDAKSGGAEPLVIKLKHAKAEIIAEKVESLLQPKKQGVHSPGAARTAAQVVADYRTNTIFVTGDERALRLAAFLVRELDKPSEIERIICYYLLENTSPGEIAYTLGEMFDANVSESLNDTDSGSSESEEAPETSASVSERKSTRLEKPPDGISQAVLDEIPLIIPEASHSRVIVIAPSNIQKGIAKAIEKLDIRKPQVLIEMAIVEITAEKGFNLTTELSTIDVGSRATFGFGNTQFGVSSFTDTNGDGVFDLRVPVRGLSGLLTGVSRNGQIPLLIHALSTKTDINVVSTPLLLVNDNEEAKFESIRDEPTTERVIGENVDTITFKEFVEAGIKVRIIPAISEGGKYLRLYIEQDVDSFIGASIAAGIPPPRQRNHLTTTVTVPNNKAVIIGGLAVNNKTRMTSGVPFLSKIPLIGWLFRGRNDSHRRTRLYLFIRPQILDDADFGDLEEATRAKQKDVESFNKKIPGRDNSDTGSPNNGDASPEKPDKNRE